MVNDFPCSGCGIEKAAYQKGEFFLCERCYQAAKGLYTKVEIEAAIQKVNRVN
jgi:hypothetical protein